MDHSVLWFGFRYIFQCLKGYFRSNSIQYLTFSCRNVRNSMCYCCPRHFTESVPVVEARESCRVAWHESVDVCESESAAPSLRPEEGQAELDGGDAAPGRHEVAPREVLEVFGARRMIWEDLQSCAKEMSPVWKSPPPVRPEKVTSQCTAQSANFGKFWLNSLNLELFLLLNPVLSQLNPVCKLYHHAQRVRFTRIF